MPIRSLAERYPDLIYEENNEKRIQEDPFVTLIQEHDLPDLTELEGQTFYDRLSDFLRTTNDAQFGIKSSLNNEGEWVRDATKVSSPQERVSQRTPAIEANKALLRCLCLLKATDYALFKKMEVGLRCSLKEEFERIAFTILAHANGGLPEADKLQRIKAFEEDFNGCLIKHLREANLTRGCKSKRETKKLLSHYRNLSSLMQPARTLVTLTYDEKAGLLQRETKYPVTKKTAPGLQSLSQLNLSPPRPFKEKTNSSTAGNGAIQEANKLFYELMDDETRFLPEQARLVVVKKETISLRPEEILDEVKENKAAIKDTSWNAVGTNTLSKQASTSFNLHSANADKRNEVKANKAAFLTKPSQVALNEFNGALERFKDSLNAKTIKEGKEKQHLYEQGQSILKNINTLVANDPSKLDAHSLEQLTEVLANCTTLVISQDPSLAENQESVRCLDGLIQEVSGKKSEVWKALGAGLISFACLAVGTVGVLAAIPTGGGSLLLTAIAATGLSAGAVGAVAVTGAAAVTATAAAGLGVYSAGREKGLAQSVKNFKANYLDIITNQDEEKPQDSSDLSESSPLK